MTASTLHSVTATAAGRRDEHGNPTSGSADAVALYDRGLDRLLRFDPEVVQHATQLVTEHPETPMGQALMAYLLLSSTDRADAVAAREVWDVMSAASMNDREGAHHRAIGCWVAGDWRGAAKALDGVVERWPGDLLALMLGHQLDFFVGDAANLRDRPGRVLLDLDPDHGHTAFVRGMQAFGLEESGSYEHAEDAGRAALAANPDDVWAIHAVTHAFEMRGRVGEGIRFLVEREADWGSGNLFTVHSWWHLALFHLEAGAIDRALAIYDATVHNEGSAGVPLEMVDASALLWRIALDGHDVGDRFEAIADAWSRKVEDEPWYAFNDVHAVMALVGAGRHADAGAVVARLERFVGDGGNGSNVAMTADVGLPAARAIVSFGEGRHGDAVDDLAPIRGHLNRFGGSHAQRDVLQRTLLVAAIASGRADLARALVSERLAVRETSVWTWGERARLLRALGRDEEAVGARETAAAHQASFAAAV